METSLLLFIFLKENDFVKIKHAYIVAIFSTERKQYQQT